MPEGPEVEKLARYLANHWVGHQVLSIQPIGVQPARQGAYADKFFEPLTRVNFINQVKHLRIAKINRFGKWVSVEDQHGPLWAFHLKSTGWFLREGENQEPFPHQNFLHAVNEKSARLRFEIGEYLGQDQEQWIHTDWVYHDGRTWGRFVRICVGDLFPWKDYGPDWIREEEKAAILLSGFETTTKKTVKQVLCDPTITAGLGNYLSCEACFGAGIRPNEFWRALDPQSKKLLANSVMWAVRSAMAIQDHSWWGVFDKRGELCRNCGSKIQYEKDPGGSRGSYFCPICQPERKMN